MARAYGGSCQCGAVAYEALGRFEAFYLCHCARCRKDTGSAHASNLFSSTAELRWLSGREDVRIHRVPGTRHVKSFCVHCGSPVPTVDGATLLVPAGSLDVDPEIAPTAHIFCDDAAPWDEGLERVPRFRAGPERGD